MTDLEMTKLCAKAIGLSYELDECGSYFDSEGSGRNYWPLHDDAQAMALVKKLGINVWWSGSSWRALISRRNEQAVLHEYDVWNDDLNHAIVECVAKLTIQSQRALEEDRNGQKQAVQM